MIFTSFDFLIFLPVVFALYWITGTIGRKVQNVVILLASYFFYGWWDWRFLILIVLSSAVDFFIGLALDRTDREKPRKLLLATSLIVNLGILALFKYFNFFVESLQVLLEGIGFSAHLSTLHLILPVGISFYTFQTLSYSIDVYRRKINAAQDVLAFFSFVGFFPQLVAGPIERAKNLLPQFQKKRSFAASLAIDGLKQMAWGFFQKMVIADNCAPLVDTIFANHESLPASALLLGAFLFAFQIYGDFAGYSNIAIGLSNLFGIQLQINFNYPYFSRNIAEFWRRWHISLTTWFKEYLYFPMGGSRGGLTRTIRNIFIVFLVSGLWHGARWTFVAWGLLHALYYLPGLIAGRNRRFIADSKATDLVLDLRTLVQIFATFSATCLAWVFFRSQSITESFSYIKGIFDSSILEMPYFYQHEKVPTVILLILFLLIVEYRGRDFEHPLRALSKKSKQYRWVFFMLLLVITVLFARTEEVPFIYFQF